MRIIYIANHGQHNNDDEGAIAHALTELGHTVICLDENIGRHPSRVKGDLLLFHKWRYPDMLRYFEGKMVRVFWYFDLVDFPDPTLHGRNLARQAWMADVVPLVDIGFCTDGDWVAKDVTGKLVHLVQGADGRKVGPGAILGYPISLGPRPSLLFFGTAKGGELRQSFVSEMVNDYGASFQHVPGTIYGRDLANLIAGAEIVLAPDGPVSDRYWSNRVYMTLGYKGFLLHPCCSLLRQQYDEGELVMYESREQLHWQIEYYTDRAEERKRIAEAGYRRTLHEHLYKHRCEKLIQAVAERFGP